ncbi:MAG: hypothetical protein AAF196_13350 [Planctomycetota bacterium]
MEPDTQSARWSQLQSSLLHATEQVETWLEMGALSFDPRFLATLGRSEIAELRFLDRLWDRCGDSRAFAVLAQRLQRPVRFDFEEVAFCFATDSWIPCSPESAQLTPIAATFDFDSARQTLGQATTCAGLIEHDRRTTELLGLGFLPGHVNEQLSGLEDLAHTGVLPRDLNRISAALEEDLDGFQSLIDRVSDLRDEVPTIDSARQLLGFFEATKIPGRARPLATRALFAAAPRCFVPLDHEWSMRSVLDLPHSSKALHSQDLTIAAGEYVNVMKRAHEIARAEPAEVGRLLAADPCTPLDLEGLAVKSWPRVLDRLAWIRADSRF